MPENNLQLPKTAFSMKANLPSKEPKILETWEKTKLYEESKDPQDVLSISGTEVRQALMENKSLPDWFIRGEVLDIIKKEMDSGKEIFY